MRALCEMSFRPDLEDATTATESDSQCEEGDSQQCLLVFSNATSGHSPPSDRPAACRSCVKLEL